MLWQYLSAGTVLYASFLCLFFYEWPALCNFIVFWNTHLMLLLSCVAWNTPSGLFSVPESSCHQRSDRQTVLVPTFLACLVDMCASTAFTALWFDQLEIKLICFHILLVWRYWAIHCRPCGCVLNATMSLFLEPIMHKTPYRLTCDSLIETVRIHVKVMKLWGADFPKFFGRCFEQVPHSIQMANHFFFHHKHSTPVSFISFTHYILAVNCTVHDGFLQHACF
jgi:hypothetical protein